MPSEYFTARFQLEILTSLRRDFRDLQSEPQLPNGGQADAVVIIGEEQVYFEITFLQPPYKLSTEIPNAMEKVKKEIEKALMDRPWKIRVRLLSFPENSDIQHLVDGLRRIESTPASLRWTWAEIDISGKRLTERITGGATVQVAGPPFSEGERVFDKVTVKGKQLHPDKPGFVIIRPTLPAVNVSLAEIEIRKALKELQPQCLLGILVVTESIGQDRRHILLFRNPYMDKRHAQILGEVRSNWKFRLGSIAYSFLKDQTDPVCMIVGKGDVNFEER